MRKAPLQIVLIRIWNFGIHDEGFPLLDIEVCSSQRNLKNYVSIFIPSNTSIILFCSQSTNSIRTSFFPFNMEHEEGKQSSHKNPYVELEEVDFDYILAIGLQEQERAFTMLSTIESESDEYISDSSFDNDDSDFLESQEFDNDEDDEMEVEEDEIDPDELSYEELIELEEFIGEEAKGLSANEISLCLYPYTCQSCETKSGIDRCVICQVEYEEGEALVALKCDHPYHTDCISKWLQIKKVCPICSNEVSTPNMASNP
ncbi:hypothetical protein RJT34_09759 [Clitoria ternatea]|uniref:RING-type domain-containing protein n=1 Tax=Clitoria ternatea TaxID=43366 RepID=A0AAN9K972_CLITE